MSGFHKKRKSLKNCNISDRNLCRFPRNLADVSDEQDVTFNTDIKIIDERYKVTGIPT